MKKAFLPAFLWLVVVTILSTMPGIQLPNFNLFSADKLAHAFIYAVLSWLVLRGFSKISGQKPTTKEYFLAFAASAFYGAFMEWVQGTFLPSRFFEWDDMIANDFGALVSVLTFALVLQFKKT